MSSVNELTAFPRQSCTFVAPGPAQVSRWRSMFWGAVQRYQTLPLPLTK